MGAAGVQRAAEARDQRGVDEHRPGACARAPAARRSRPHGRGRRTSSRGRSRAGARARRRRARRAHGRRAGPAPAARAAAASAPTAAPGCRAASAAPGSRWLRRPLPGLPASRGRHRCRRWRRAASRAGTGPHSRARAGDRRGAPRSRARARAKRALTCGDRRRHGELGGQRGDESPAAVAEPSAPGNERRRPLAAPAARRDRLGAGGRRPLGEHQVVQRLRRQRQAAVAAAHQVDPPRQAGRDAAAGSRSRAARSGTAASAGTTLMPSPARTMPITVASWSTSITVCIACGRKRGVEVLAHAAGARQVDEGPGREVARLDRRARLRQRMVGAADEVEVVGCRTALRLQLGRLGAHRRRARSRPASCVTRSMQGSESTSATSSSMPGWRGAKARPAPPAASRRPATAAAPARRGRGARRRGRACRPWRCRTRPARAAPGLRSRRLRPSARHGACCGRTGARRASSSSPPDQRAERRLRQVHRRRGAREVALLGERRARRAAGGVERPLI